MMSYKFVLCAALLVVAATAQKSPSSSPDMPMDDGSLISGDYAAAPTGDYAGDYAPTGDYAAAPGTGDYAEDYTYAAAPGTGDYADYAEAPTPAAGPTAPIVKPTVTPAAAPAAAPTGPKVLTIGALVGATCQGIKDVLAGPNFTTLMGLLKAEEIAGTEITLPKGVVVVAAPTNEAFAAVIKAVGPAAAANMTLIGEILANHIATAPAASESTATALSGETLAFWTEMGGVGGNPSPVPTGIAALAASNKNGVITDAEEDEMAKVVGAVACATEGQYAFGIDTVLLPVAYDIKVATAPAPAPAPAPSAGFKASAAFAAVAGAVALVM